DPETGQPLEFPWKVAIDRLLVLENPDAKVLELAGSDMTPYLRAHERDIQDIAVITRTPRHYLFQEGQSPSGDAIKSAETGLVAKVRDKQDRKSTRLNSSHVKISYAVFCLKKKMLTDVLPMRS